MIQTYDLAHLRRLERKLALPLDPEQERWDASRYRYLMDDGRVYRVPTVRGGSGFSQNDSYVSSIFNSAAAGAALATFTTEASMYAAAQVNGYIPADFFDPTYGVNRALRFTLRGIYSTTGTPTFTLGLRADSVSGTPILGTSLAITSQSGVTNLIWEIECDITCASVLLGSAHNEATLATFGMVSGVSTGSNGFTNGSAIGTQTPTTPATLTQSDARHYLFPTATCGTSSASNKWQMLHILIQALN